MSTITSSENEQVMKQIFNLLPVKYLKKCRLIGSRQWMILATKQMMPMINFCKPWAEKYESDECRQSVVSSLIPLVGLDAFQNITVTSLTEIEELRKMNLLGSNVISLQFLIDDQSVIEMERKKQKKMRLMEKEEDDEEEDSEEWDSSDDKNAYYNRWDDQEHKVVLNNLAHTFIKLISSLTSIKSLSVYPVVLDRCLVLKQKLGPTCALFCTRLENLDELLLSKSRWTDRLLEQKTLEKLASIQLHLTSLELVIANSMPINTVRMAIMAQASTLSKLTLRIKYRSHTTAYKYNAANFAKDNWFIPLALHNLKVLTVEATDKGPAKPKLRALVAAIQLPKLVKLVLKGDIGSKCWKYGELMEETELGDVGMVAFHGGVPQLQSRSLKYLEFDNTDGTIDDSSFFDSWFHPCINVKELVLRRPTAQVLQSIFRRWDLEKLVVAMNYEPETGGWDDILLGRAKKIKFHQQGSIALLNNLKELSMVFYYGDLSTLTDNFAYEGLMKLEKLQKLKMLTMLQPGFQFSDKAKEDLQRALPRVDVSSMNKWF